MLSSARLTFRPGSSFLHRLHPVVKLVWLVFLTVFVFMTSTILWVLAILALSLIAFPLWAGSLKGIRGLRIFVFTGVFLALLQIAFTRHGQVLLDAGSIVITVEGLRAGILVGSRFLCIILLSYLFVLTTAPNDFAYGLMQVGLPYRLGFALVTALRFVPLFEQEGLTIYQAQLARGVQYDRRNWKKLLIFARQLVLPILVSILRKVDALAISMEGRSFGRYTDRTYYHPLQVTARDWAAVGVLFLAILLSLFV